MKQGNPWINHVKKMAAKKGISYRDALRHPDTKSSYQKGAKDAIKDAVLGAGHSKNKIYKVGGTLLKGIPKNVNCRACRERIQTNGLMHGGSFLPLGE